MSFAKIPITVMVSSRVQVDTTTYAALGLSKHPVFTAGELVILCFHFINDDGSDYALGASDLFEFGGDLDYDHYVAEGNLSTAIAAQQTLTAIVATSGLATTSIRATGHLRLTNAAGETERIAYTAFNPVSLTFTVNATALYAYTTGATLQVEDELMLYSDSTQVDIAGDWADIDRTAGKISVRVAATADAYSRKLEDASDSGKTIYLELRCYPSGSTSRTTLYADTAKAKASVIGDCSAPGTTSAQYLTDAVAAGKYAQLTNAAQILTMLSAILKADDGNSVKLSVVATGTDDSGTTQYALQLVKV